jgi:peroxiredoxin Q/BCP
MTAELTAATNAQRPQAGQPLPDFSMPAAVPQADGTVQETTLSLSDFKGRPLVLFFYPKDATSGCTIEVCGFRDLYPEFEKAGVAVVGASRDTVRSHGRFIQNQNLPYPLLADPEQEIVRGWDLIVNKKMYGKPVTGVLRCTFVVDKDGVVRHVYEKVTPLGHAQEVLDLVRNGL